MIGRNIWGASTLRVFSVFICLKRVARPWLDYVARFSLLEQTGLATPLVTRTFNRSGGMALIAREVQAVSNPGMNMRPWSRVIEWFPGNDRWPRQERDRPS